MTVSQLLEFEWLTWPARVHITPERCPSLKPTVVMKDDAIAFSCFCITLGVCYQLDNAQRVPKINSALRSALAESLVDKKMLNQR